MVNRMRERNIGVRTEIFKVRREIYMYMVPQENLTVSSSFGTNSFILYNN